VIHLAETNDKKRFEWKDTPNGLKIKATQGHTVQVSATNHKKFVCVAGSTGGCSTDFRLHNGSFHRGTFLRVSAELGFSLDFANTGSCLIVLRF